MVEQILEFSEKVMYRLRNLYAGYGYRQYKMSKFEEYDFYVRNKDFLISDSIITFTDTNGKLMALKPDVTLSIVKNSSQDLQGVQKLYYNENVYRTSKDGTYQEMMQVGLECIGKVDSGCIAEVLQLAAKSLRLISPDCILNISHLGVLADLMDAMKKKGYTDQELIDAGLVSQKGFTLIPLSLYFSGSHVKVEIGLCRGKKMYDKRDDAAKRDAKRNMDRALRERNR